jgi:alkylated DNA nucleotide flippase Atl1
MFSPPNPKTFNAIVYEIVKQIPPGKVSTYGQVASMISPDVEPPLCGWGRAGWVQR